MRELKELVCIHVIAHTWSGRKMLTVHDLDGIVDAEKLPPEQLAKLGSKHVYPAEKLRPFHTLIKRVERACLVVGSRFLGGYVVPRAKAAALAIELKTITEEFGVQTQVFLREYRAVYDAWREKWKDYPQMFTDSDLVEPERVQASFSLGTPMFSVQSPRSVPERHSQLTTQLDTLGFTVLEEVGAGAAELLKHSVRDRSQVTQATVKSARKLIDKLAGLHFVVPGSAPLLQSITQAMAQLPLTGRLKDSDITVLRGVLEQLAAARHGTLEVLKTEVKYSAPLALTQGKTPHHPDAAHPPFAAAKPLEQAWL